MREMGSIVRFLLGITCAAVLGCTGQITDGGGTGDEQPGEVTLEITSPADGASFVRESVGSQGELVAALNLQVETSGPIAGLRVESASGADLGELSLAELNTIVELDVDGGHTLTVVAVDANGGAVATESVSVTVSAPAAASCHEWLDLYNLSYELGPTRQGVSDPVTVTTPINGIVHRYSANDTPRDTFFMDCSLALSLARAASHLRRRDIIELVDMGVYNYRCIGGGTPPDCPNGISQHAYAKGIDIAGFTTSDGEYYSVNDDWVIDPDSEPTCAAPTEAGKDEFLHELICDIKADGIWNIVLTPNFNAAHRNHFHVDLTTGSNFIESRANAPRRRRTAVGGVSVRRLHP